MEMRLVPNLKQVALRLPDDLAEWLEQLAEEEERSVAYVVREIIAAEYERRKTAPPHLKSVT
jgi:predicted DNA-binding protein